MNLLSVLENSFLRAALIFLLSASVIAFSIHQLKRFYHRLLGAQSGAQSGAGSSSGGMSVARVLADTLVQSFQPVLFAIVLGFIVTTSFVPELPSSTTFRSIGIALLVVQLGFTITRLFSSLLQYWTDSPSAPSPTLRSHRGLLNFLGLLAIWSTVLLTVLSNLGFDITALITGLGIGGIAIALAVQNILGDLFSSLSIALDRPFEVGDFITVDQEAGTVEQIGIKTTRLRSLNGEQVIISNTDLLRSRVHNFKRMIERREVLRVGVTYDTPLAKLRELSGALQEIISQQPRVRFDRASFRSFGESALEFEAVYFVVDPSIAVARATTEAINLAVMEYCATKGIEFAFPTRTLYVRREAEAAVSGNQL